MAKPFVCALEGHSDALTALAVPRRGVLVQCVSGGADGEVLLKSDDAGGWFGGTSRKQKREARRRARAGKKNKLSEVQSSVSKIRDTASALLGDDTGVSTADLAMDLGGLTAAAPGAPSSRARRFRV